MMQTDKGLYIPSISDNVEDAALFPSAEVAREAARVFMRPYVIAHSYFPETACDAFWVVYEGVYFLKLEPIANDH